MITKMGTISNNLSENENGKTKIKLPGVAVLMSTYNGERYVAEQIESILGQKDVQISLFIRDDGSRDETIEILKEYEKMNNIHVYYSSNIGCGESFWQLMCNCNGFEYYAFSDQDDIWLEDKLIRAIDMIREKADCARPILYCANFWLVDEDLHKTKQEKVFDFGKLSKDNLIVTNIRACGNTMVWTNELHKIITCKKDTLRFDVAFHDLWVEFFAAMVGDILIDPERVILYRQHLQNVSGGSYVANTILWIKSRINYIFSNRILGPYERKHYDELRAKYCLENYREFLSEERIGSLLKVVNYRKSIRNTIELLNSNVCKNVPLKVKIRVLIHRV